MKGFSYLRNVATLKIEPEKCIGCGKCLEVCLHQVFALNGDKATFINFDSCMECGACAKNCPTDALQVGSGVGCAAGLIKEWLRDHRLLGVSGECC
ncbi:MAG: 4Fe-4S binding protein [Deltaproteobacteria bacterium]|nr:4Fe-4S binding protein [Deltaproteobacteria bacterium]